MSEEKKNERRKRGRRERGKEGKRMTNMQRGKHVLTFISAARREMTERITIAQDKLL